MICEPKYDPWSQIIGRVIRDLVLFVPKVVYHIVMPPKVKPLVTVAPRPKPSGEVIDWIQAYESRHGERPKVKTVMQEFGLSQGTAHRRIIKASKTA